MKTVVKQLAQELDLHPCTLYNWLGSYRFDKFRFAESAGNYKLTDEFYQTLIEYVSLRRSRTAKQLLPKLKKLYASKRLD